MEEVFVAGAAMTQFGKHLERSSRELVEEAVAGALTGQESIRGQVMLRRTGLLGVPSVNVENACASSSTAFHLGWQAVAAGMQECVLVVGYEKLYDPYKQKSFRAFNSSMDL